jgi:hypothetical protein
MTNLSVLMIDHNVMRLNISMHNTLAVAEVQSLEELKDVEPDIDVIELRVEASEIGIVDVLENEGRRLTLFAFVVSYMLTMSVEKVGTNLRIPNNVEQGNNIRTSGQILEDLNLALDLLLLHRL